jgi:hypothetical protein
MVPGRALSPKRAGRSQLLGCLWRLPGLWWALNPQTSTLNSRSCRLRRRTWSNQRRTGLVRGMAAMERLPLLHADPERRHSRPTSGRRRLAPSHGAGAVAGEDSGEAGQSRPSRLRSPIKNQNSKIPMLSTPPKGPRAKVVNRNFADFFACPCLLTTSPCPSLPVPARRIFGVGFCLKNPCYNCAHGNKSDASRLRRSRADMGPRAAPRWL